MDGGIDRPSLDSNPELMGLTKLEGLSKALAGYGAKYASCEIESLPTGKTRLRLKDGWCNADITTSLTKYGRVNVLVNIALTSSSTESATGPNSHVFSFDSDNLKDMNATAAAIFSMLEERQVPIIENELANAIVAASAKDKRVISVGSDARSLDGIIVRSGAWAARIIVTIDEIGVEVRFDISRDGVRDNDDTTREVFPLVRENGVLGTGNLLKLFTRAHLRSDKSRTYQFGMRLDDVADIPSVAADVKEILLFMEDNVGGGREREVTESAVNPPLRDLIKDAHAGQPVRNLFRGA